ncbi:hypothetical protein GGX14DRAFT_673978 [Mycena pura]|uniref:F-box domain-containing protein n=1 Tax=Mycena pura TaxID=153505 RepID=A0AAD6Y4G1_9AGAR|nr:hypothetical protein GGX14DRAFT_673978 [Mycena pura]
MSSAFATKLGTNYCPNVEEAAELKALLVEPVLRLKRLDDEIAEMQRAIDKLTEERNRVAAYISAHKALLSPVRSLPLDIIQEIFGACLPTDRNCVMSTSEAPVLLGRICSSWRAISLSTPSLWASIHIAESTSPPTTNMPSIIFQKTMDRIEIIKTWLSRSGHCPLSISLRSSSEWTMAPFMEAILSFAHRWQHIRLAVSRVALEVLGRLTPTDVPILRSLWLIDFDFSPGFDWSRLEILRAAHISRLSLWGYQITAEALSLRWDQLTELDIGDTSWQPHLTNEAILEMISKCSRLQTCKLTFTHPVLEPHIDVAGPAIEITSLRIFSLKTDGEAFAIALLGRLALPNLRHLSFSGPFVKRLQAVEQEDQTLCRFLKISTKLETFSICSGPFSKSFLLQTLHSLPPTLRHLEIMVDIELEDDWGIPTETPISPFDDGCLRALNADPTRPYLFPKLQTLYINCCPRISDEAILEFIHAWMALEECSLKRVHFGLERHAEVDIFPRLQPFIDAGLDFSVAYLGQDSFSPWLGLPYAPGVFDPE